MLIGVNFIIIARGQPDANTRSKICCSGTTEQVLQFKTTANYPSGLESYVRKATILSFNITDLVDLANYIGFSSRSSQISDLPCNLDA